MVLCLCSQPPEHLDGVDDANVGVVEVIKRPKGEGRQGPNHAEQEKSHIKNL